MRAARPLALTLLLLGAGCGPSASSSPPPRAENDTSLGQGDVFEVRVYGEEDLNSNYRVEQDGSIRFPYLGRIEVVGLEPPQVADLLEARLRDGGVLVNPQVSVLVTNYESRQVSVMGAVNNPGVYPVTPGLTAFQAIGLAGGTTDLADRDGAILTRRVEGRMRRYQIPLDQISVGDTDDVPVRADDIILVPERPF
jgi:protein involved in polysaccharide export with SLBB domain